MEWEKGSLLYHQLMARPKLESEKMVQKLVLQILTIST